MERKLWQIFRGQNQKSGNLEKSGNMWVHNAWDFSRIDKAIYSQIQKAPKQSWWKET